MAITLPYLRSQDKHHHRGLSTMAYILLFSAATFCAARHHVFAARQEVRPKRFPSSR